MLIQSGMGFRKLKQGFFFFNDVNDDIFGHLDMSTFFSLSENILQEKREKCPSPKNLGNQVMAVAPSTQQCSTKAIKIII